MSLPWVKARYIRDAPLIHLAEVNLYASEEYTGFVLCEAREHFLVVGCPREIRQEIIPGLVSISPELCRIFTEGLREWSGYLSTLDRELWSEKEYEWLPNPNAVSSSNIDSRGPE